MNGPAKDFTELGKATCNAVSFLFLRQSIGIVKLSWDAGLD